MDSVFNFFASDCVFSLLMLTSLEQGKVAFAGGGTAMMGLAWRSLEARIKRDPEFRQQMIEKYRQACRDNPWLGDEFDHFLQNLGILDEVRSSDETGD
jgi:hypothetical protein